MPARMSWVPCLTCLLLLLAGSSLQAEVLLTERGPVTGELTAVVGVEGGVALELGEDRYPLADIRTITFSASLLTNPEPLMRFYLTDGSIIRGRLMGGNEESVTVSPEFMGRATLTLPLDVLRAMVWVETEEELAHFEETVLPETSADDVIRLKGGTILAGLLVAFRQDGLVIETDELGEQQIAFSRIASVSIAALGDQQAPQGLHVKAYMREGSVLTGTLQPSSGRSLQLATVFGNIEVARHQLHVIEVHGGRYVYLSNLEPTEVVERSFWFESVSYPLRRDRNVMGGALMVDGVRYRRGLGVHAYSRVTYELAGRYREFRAVVGLDDSTRTAETILPGVRFQVYVDGRPRLGDGGLLLTTDDGSSVLRVSCEGAETLTLEVDFGEHGDVLARGNWADAHLIR